MEQNNSSQTEGIRLNKFLSDAGVCSRRQADHYVEEGRIEINGRKAMLGERINGDEEIRLDDRLIKINQKKILLVVNKPKGIVCTTQEKDKDNIVDFLGYPERIYPVGRLDKDSEGLILMTNDGALMDEILRARNYHEKEYEVRVDKPITKEFIEKMSSGVEILDTVTRPCKVEQINRYRFRITLTQGLNRQIRRMCEALEYRVRDLKRIRIMNIRLGSLPLGAYRELTPQEWEELKELITKGKDAPEFLEHFDTRGTSAQANVRRARGSREERSNRVPGRYSNRTRRNDSQTENRADSGTAQKRNWRDRNDSQTESRADRSTAQRRSWSDRNDSQSESRTDRSTAQRRNWRDRNDSQTEGRADRSTAQRRNWRDRNDSQTEGRADRSKRNFHEKKSGTYESRKLASDKSNYNRNRRKD